MRSIPIHIVLDSTKGITDHQAEQIAESFIDYGVGLYMHVCKRVTPGTFVIKGHAYIEDAASVVTLMNELHSEFSFLDLIYAPNLCSAKTDTYIADILAKWKSERKFFQQCLPPSPIDVIEEMFASELSKLDGLFRERLNHGELKTYGHVAISLSDVLNVSVGLLENLQSSLEHHFKKS